MTIQQDKCLATRARLQTFLSVKGSDPFIILIKGKRIFRCNLFQSYFRIWIQFSTEGSSSTPISLAIQNELGKETLNARVEYLPEFELYSLTYRKLCRVRLVVCLSGMSQHILDGLCALHPWLRHARNIIRMNSHHEHEKYQALLELQSLRGSDSDGSR